jgi:hypothetical protein
LCFKYRTGEFNYFLNEQPYIKKGGVLAGKRQRKEGWQTLPKNANPLIMCAGGRAALPPPFRPIRACQIFCVNSIFRFFPYPPKLRIIKRLGKVEIGK